MNSILNNRWQNNQPQTLSFNQFKTMFTPLGAKQEIEKRLKSGEITPQQLENAKQILNSILNK